MATYKQIQAYVLRHYGFKPKTSWIAHVKEMSGLPVKRAWNRCGPDRKAPCPPGKVEPIWEALRQMAEAGGDAQAEAESGLRIEGPDVPLTEVVIGVVMRDKDEKAIRQVLASYIRAFEDADAELMQSLFWADDPAFTEVENHIQKPFGREEFHSIMEWIGRNRPSGGKMRFYETKIHILSPQVAYAVSMRNELDMRELKWTRVTMIFLKRGDEWRIIHGHSSNVPVKQQPVLSAKHPLRGTQGKGSGFQEQMGERGEPLRGQSPGGIPGPSRTSSQRCSGSIPEGPQAPRTSSRGSAGSVPPKVPEAKRKGERSGGEARGTLASPFQGEGRLPQSAGRAGKGRPLLQRLGKGDDMNEPRIRVLIVEDCAGLRELIRKLLQFEPDMLVVGTAANGVEAIELYDALLPNVVTMCINMPAMDGITATEEICKRHPEARIVIFSLQGDPDHIRRAMLAGAKDFIQKPASGEELIASIRRWASVRG